MSDEYDNPENDDSHDEENEEQEFSLDQSSAAYANVLKKQNGDVSEDVSCLLYTSPSPRDRTRSRMPSSA